MKKIFSLLLLSCIISVSSTSFLGSESKSAPVPNYVKTKSGLYGGASYEGTKKTKVTSDGGAISVGITSSSNSGDVTEENPYSSSGWIVKVDENMNVQWSDMFSFDKFGINPSDVIETSNNTYFITGNSVVSDSYGVAPHPFIIEYDQDGNVIRQLRTSAWVGNWESIEHVVETENYYTTFGYLEGAKFNGEMVDNRAIEILQFDKDPSEIFPVNYKVIDGNNDEDVSEVKILENGNIGVSGFSSSTKGVFSGNKGGSDFFFLEMKEDLSIVKSVVYGSAGEDRNSGFSQARDGNIYLYGSAGEQSGQVVVPITGESSGWAIELDSNYKIINEISLSSEYSVYDDIIDIDDDKILINAQGAIKVYDHTGKYLYEYSPVHNFDIEKYDEHRISIGATKSTGDSLFAGTSNGKEDLGIAIVDFNVPEITSDKKRVIELGTTYTDEELISLFNVSALSSDKEVLDNSYINVDKSAVIWDKVGEYTIKFKVTDKYDRTAEVSGQLIIKDKDDIKPELVADSNQTVEAGKVYSDAELITLFNVAAYDSDGTNITDRVIVDQSGIDYTTLGTYEVIFSLVTKSKDTLSVKSSLKIIDRTAPELIVDSSRQSEVFKPLTDEQLITLFNASATDNFDAKVDIVVDQSDVNYNKIGNYDVVFSSRDTYGNKSIITSTIRIVDKTAPVITGDEEHDIEVGTRLSDAELIDLYNIEVTDNYDTTFKIYVNQYAVDYDTVGTYDVVFSVYDSSSNSASKKVKLNIVDLSTPTIETDSEKISEVGLKLSDAQLITLFNAKATDKEGNSLDVKVDQSSVDYSKLGENIVSFSAIDSKGSSASKDATLKLVDTTKPVITADESHEVEVGNKQTDSELIKLYNVIATDNYDSKLDITADQSDVDYDKVGEYKVVFTATDSSGNSSLKEVTLKVVDTTKPVITADESHEVEVGNKQTDSELIKLYNVIATDNYDSKLDITVDQSAVDYDTVGEYQILFSATDSSGNNSLKEVTLKVVDTTKPIITADESHEVEVGNKQTDSELIKLYNVITIDNYDSKLDITVDQSAVDYDAVGEYKVVFTATDSSGNSSLKEVTLKVVDTTKPVITADESHEVEVGNKQTDSELIKLYNVVATDNYDSKLDITVDQSAVDYDTVGEYKVVFTATDSSGNSSLKEVTLKVIDTTKPVITADESHEVEVGNKQTDSELIKLYNVIAIDNYDSKLDITVDQSAVDYDTVGEYKVVFTATDSSGNSSLKEVTLKVIDTTKPVITADESHEVEVGNKQTDSELIKLYNVIAIDNYDSKLDITVDQSAVDYDIVGEYKVVFTATDSSGNSSLKEVTLKVVDTTKPVITADESHEVEVGNKQTDSELIKLYNVVATDNYDSKLDITVDQSAVDYDTVGEYKVVFTATDSSGNSSLKEVTLKVVDTTKPVITADESHEVEVGNKQTDSELIKLYNVVATDNYDSKLDITADQSAVDYDTVGEYKVVFTATDSSGNSSVKEVTLKVVDTTKPVITADESHEVEVGNKQTDSELIKLYNVIATDNYDSKLDITADQSAVDYDTVGEYKVVFTATDSSGNSSVKEVTLKVVDTTKPVITADESHEVEVGNKQTDSELIKLYNVIATDNYDSKLDITVDQSDVEYDTVGEYKVVFTATDSSGNSSLKEVTLKVVDTTKPVITADESHEVEVGNKQTDSKLIKLYNVIATDNYDSKLDITVDQSDVEYDTVGEYKVVFTATDSSGNSSLKEVTLKVVDTTKPVITADESHEVEVGNKQTDSKLIKLYNVVATDNYDSKLDITVDQSDVDYDTVGEYKVVFTATDSSGNSSVKEVTLKVVAIAGPEITADLEKTSEVRVKLTADQLIKLFNVVATDKDGNTLDVNVDDSAVNYNKLGTYDVVFSARDSYTHETSKTSKLTIVDTIAPTLTANDSQTIEVISSLSDEELIDLFAVKVVDNYDTKLDITVDQSDVDYDTVGEYKVVFTATDSSGNSSVKEVKLKVVDTTKPVITADESHEVEVGSKLTDEELINLFNVIATDNYDSKLDITTDQSDVEYDKVGEYKVVFTAIDSSGNSSLKEVKLKVVDTTKPVITADESHEVEVGSKLTDEELIKLYNVVATDNYDSKLDITVDQSDVDYDKVGEYKVVFTAIDSSGNSSLKEVTLKVVAIAGPEITADLEKTTEVRVKLTADQLIKLFNVVATDKDGNTVDVNVDDSAVDYNKLGTYDVVFSATDSYTHETSKTSKLTIVDTTAPTLTANDSQTTEVISALSDEELIDLFAVKVVDNYDTKLDITVDQSAVDYDKLGEYKVVFTATDSSGNSSLKEVTLKVVDTTKPVITADESHEVEVGSKLTDEELINLFNVIATDNYDSKLDITTDQSDVDYDKVGEYKVVFTAIDSSGNRFEKISILSVIDKPDLGLPVIMSDPIHLSEVGMELSDAQIISLFNISAIDSDGNDITDDIIIDQSAVDYMLLGKYQISLDVTDSKGNSAPTKMVTIDIADTTKPQILANIDSETEVGKTLTDEQLISIFNVKANDNYDSDLDIIVDQSKVDYELTGQYDVTFKTIDSSGNIAEVVSKLKVVDSIKPNVNADESHEVTLGKELTDNQIIDLFNVTVSDNYDSDLAIIVDQSDVDYNNVGEYNVVFIVTDSSGNVIEKTVVLKIVESVEIELPQIISDDEHSIEVGTTLTNEEIIDLFNISATDSSGIDLSNSLIIDQSSVNYNKIGTYQITVTLAMRSADYTTSRDINLNVIDSTSPTISSKDYETVTIGNELSDEQIIKLFNIFAEDNYDDTLTIVIDQSKVDYNALGTYPIIIYANDSSFNESEKIEITLEVTSDNQEVSQMTNTGSNTLSYFILLVILLISITITKQLLKVKRII